MKPYDPIPPPAETTISTVHQLYASLSKAYAPVVTSFESLYATWKETWSSLGLELKTKQSLNRLTSRNCSLSAKGQGPAFDALVKLGPRIMPFVVQKLASPDDFFAVHLYNALEQDEGVRFDSHNILDHSILHRHANLILEKNHARNVAFASTARQWQEHQDINSLSCNSTDYVSGTAYQSMVQMGPSVIGNIMDQYVGEQDGWWHEMLHEIVHGRPSGMKTFFKDRLYANWRTWFESGQSQDAAPKSGWE